MTIEIKVVCDGRDCSNEVDIDDNHDSDVERAGFVVNPLDGYQHYCEKCWPIASKEIYDGF